MSKHLAGQHRLEAAKYLGWSDIECVYVEMDDRAARMWEISENLHRAELTTLERDEQINEWRLLHLQEAKKGAQLAHPLGGDQPHERGVKKTSESLNVDRREVERAMTVASLSPEAKEAARNLGLDDNRSALLQAAKKTTAKEQVAALSERAAQKPPKIAADPLTDSLASEKQVARLMDAWNAAGPEARQEFLLRIDGPVFDRGAA